MRKITPVCLGVWMVAVWAAPGVGGTSGAPRVLVPVQAAPAPHADIEKGKAAVTQIYVGCHDGGAIMRLVAVRKKTADEWRDTVYRMIGRGAQVLPDEIEPLTAYLTATGGQVPPRSEEHTSELQSRLHLVCRLLLEKKKHIDKRLSM